MNYYPMVVVGVKVELRVVGLCVGCPGCVGATVSVVAAEEDKRAEHCSPKTECLDNECCIDTVCVALSIGTSYGSQWYNSG